MLMPMLLAGTGNVGLKNGHGGFKVSCSRADLIVVEAIPRIEVKMKSREVSTSSTLGASFLSLGTLCLYTYLEDN